jgi:hypothetical protein
LTAGFLWQALDFRAAAEAGNDPTKRTLASQPEELPLTDLFRLDGEIAAVIGATGTPVPGGPSWHQTLTFIERAIAGFSSIEGLDESVAERLVGEGFLSYDDLSVIEPEDLMDMGDLTAEQVDAIVAEAEQRASQVEAAAADERRKQREADRIAKATADADAADALVAQQPTESAAAPASESATES